MLPPSNDDDDKIGLRLRNRSNKEILVIVSDRPTPASHRELSRYQETWISPEHSVGFRIPKPARMQLAPNERQKLFGETTKLHGTTYLTIQTKQPDGSWAHHVKNKPLDGTNKLLEFSLSDLHTCITPTGRRRQNTVEYNDLWKSNAPLRFKSTPAIDVSDLHPEDRMVVKKPIVDMYGETGVYSGFLSFESGKPHGKGRIEYNSRQKPKWYDGEWEHGRWKGVGILADMDESMPYDYLPSPEEDDYSKYIVIKKRHNRAPRRTSSTRKIRFDEITDDQRVRPKRILRRSSSPPPEDEAVDPSKPGSDNSILPHLREKRTSLEDQQSLMNNLRKQLTKQEASHRSKTSFHESSVKYQKQWKSRKTRSSKKLFDF